MRRLFWILFTLGFCVGLYFGLKEGRRSHCQSVYSSNPWTGGGHRNTPEWCLTPAELTRRHEVEQIEAHTSQAGK